MSKAKKLKVPAPLPFTDTDGSTGLGQLLRNRKHLVQSSDLRFRKLTDERLSVGVSPVLDQVVFLGCCGGRGVCRPAGVGHQGDLVWVQAVGLQLHPHPLVQFQVGVPLHSFAASVVNVGPHGHGVGPRSGCHDPGHLTADTHTVVLVFGVSEDKHELALIKHTPLHDGEGSGLNTVPSMVAGEVQHEVIVTDDHVC